MERGLRVFNIPTNIRNWGQGTTDYAGNSMFVFETAGLCIAHLGHLHHTLTEEHLKRLGPIDIVMIAVDGAVTISQEGAVTVIDQIKPKVVIPMHYWGYGSLERFVSLFESRYPVKRLDGSTVVFSRATLPEMSTDRGHDSRRLLRWPARWRCRGSRPGAWRISATRHG